MRDDDAPPAKTPATPLAGPYGHPFHPIAVILPIGVWVASLVFDILARSTAEPAAYAICSRTLIAIGLVGSVPAVILGIMDYLRIPGGTRASSAATFHMALNFVVCGVFAVQFLYRVKDDTVPLFLAIVTAVCLVLLGVSGWLGGKLVYRWGVRVATERTQAEGFRVE